MSDAFHVKHNCYPFKTEICQWLLKGQWAFSLQSTGLSIDPIVGFNTEVVGGKSCLSLQYLLDVKRRCYPAVSEDFFLRPNSHSFDFHIVRERRSDIPAVQYDNNKLIRVMAETF